MAELTDMQRTCLETYSLLLEGGAQPREAARKAKELAGYADSMTFRQVIQKCDQDALKRFYNTRLVEAAPQAIEKIVSLIGQGEGRGAKTELAAAESVLDRIGMAKKASMELEVTAKPGIIFLPPKQEEPQEDFN